MVARRAGARASLHHPISTAGAGVEWHPPVLPSIHGACDRCAPLADVTRSSSIRRGFASGRQRILQRCHRR